MSKILVIDDEESVRGNLVELLEAEGFDAISAENGRAGVQLARQQLPDLIICDITMPELDGYGVLDELRQGMNLGLEIAARDPRKPLDVTQVYTMQFLREIYK